MLQCSRCVKMMYLGRIKCFMCVWIIWDWPELCKVAIDHFWSASILRDLSILLSWYLIPVCTFTRSFNICKSFFSKIDTFCYFGKNDRNLKPSYLRHFVSKSRVIVRIWCRIARSIRFGAPLPKIVFYKGDTGQNSFRFPPKMSKEKNVTMPKRCQNDVFGSD